ncbi:amidohydrolase family protein [Herbiconiux sp. CPCC 205763]|uniref:Amidohydrolase family protein n=1 Tax=Herbiconiux aconitum TaxID=2970913 RepID=A0ABT2GN84_9MICO|nr:amidohydrolase family protein [Herbiconiux aconitum]MCS5717697.1 amidohydrolase family protein [Herbiconiux aconitum]
MEDPRETERLLSTFSSDPTIVGIRNLIHDRSDPDWVLQTDFNAGLTLLEEAELPFDFVTSDPVALGRLIRVADRHPDLRIVLDHLGKPPLSGTAESLESWAQLLNEAASRPNVYAKISGLYASEGSADGWTTQRVAGATKVAFDAFGPERLMYGGDWPMSTIAGGYDRVFAALRSAVEPLSGADQDAFFWRTAAEFYRLQAPASEPALDHSSDI